MEKNPFYSIVELTNAFKDFKDRFADDLSGVHDFQLRIQLAQAQQLAVIAGHLKDLVQMLKDKS